MNSDSIVQQLSIDNIPRRTWDTIIIGAGPAGSTMACHIAQKGYSVLLLEKYRFPRDKTCGDGLLGETLPILDRIGLKEAVLEQGFTVRQVKIYLRAWLNLLVYKTSTTFPISNLTIKPSGITLIKRNILDHLLAGKAVESGAVLAQESVTDICQENKDTTCIVKTSAGRELLSRSCVIATGADLRLLRKFDKQVKIKPESIALRCYVTSDYPIKDLLVLVNLFPKHDGYGWIFPMGNSLYNIGCGYKDTRRTPAPPNLTEGFEDFTRTFQPARMLMEHGEIVSKVQGARLKFRYSENSVFGKNNIIGIGECIGTTSPWNGSGIYQAMLSAQTAAKFLGEALASDDFSGMTAYPHALKRALSSLQEVRLMKC